MATAPRPEYDYAVQEIVKAYEQGIDNIVRRLERIDLTDFERAQQLALLKSVTETLRNIDKQAAEWAEQYLTLAVQEGITATMISLGVVKTVAEAETLVKFNKINSELVKAAIADTQSDLLAVTQNVEKKVRAAVRKTASEVLRHNLAQGINGTQTLNRDILAGLRKELGSAVNTGIIDAAGRRWRPSKYVNVLTRTKMMEAHKEATINEGIARGALYGVISRHGATDACSNWEGKVVKLTPEAPGDYVYIGDIPKNECFHPFCKHVVTAIRRPERYA